jgi:PAS domain S-box-containing protein
MSNSGRRQLSLPAAVAVLGVVVGAGWLAIASAPDGSPTAIWWPAGGISAALLGLTPRRWWAGLVPGILLATLAGNLLSGRDLDLSTWLAVANTAEAVVVAIFLRRGRDSLPELANLEVFLRLVVGALIGGITMAVIASTGVALLTDNTFLPIARSLSLSHAGSTLVILPIVMAPRIRRRRRLAWELPAQLAILVALTAVVFASGQTRSLEFLPLPLLVWAALRFDIAIVAGELAGFAVVVILTSSGGEGPFGFDLERGQVSALGLGAVLQAFVLATTMMTLPLAIGVEQHRRLLARVTGSERLFRGNFTESLVGMLLLRSTDQHVFEITEMNDAAAAILGGATSVGRGLDQVLDTDEQLDEVAARILAGDLHGWRTETGLRNQQGARVGVAVSLLSTDPDPVFTAQLLDLTAEHRTRRQLEAAEKLTSATLDTTAALIMVTDLYGEVLRVNGATTALTGFDEAELVGRDIWEMPFAPPGSTGFPAGLPQDLSTQVSRETDVLMKGGGKRRLLWNTSFVLDERERPTYVVITGTDLTAERTAAGLTRHLLEAAVTTAMIGIDPQGRITLFNAGAVNLLGYDGQDMVGAPFMDLLDPDQVALRCQATGDAAFQRLVAGIEGAGETASRDWTWIGADGRRHTVATTLSVAADTFAARIGYLCVGRDVTEARASQEMLIAALDKERLAVQRMKELDTAKNEFVSTVSHELRTPVTSIVGYTEMLEDGTLVDPAPEQRPLLQSIARNGQRLILLCNDLLTLSSIDAGVARWERNAIDLSAIVAGAEDALRAQIAGRRLELVVMSTDDPLPVIGDRGQLERALTNLLSNAIKFTEDGGRIEVSTEARDGEALLVVSDTGIGIPVEEQSGLFQRFFRSSTAQERAIQGTGLGLSIVAAIVATHGGRIDVRSAHLEGTTFTVRLPLARG